VISSSRGGTIVNVSASNIRAPKYMQQLLTCLKGERDNSSTVIVEDFSTTLSKVGRSFRQKMSKGTLDLNYTFVQMD
jgi:AAA15 family ATPase/GTPase